MDSSNVVDENQPNKGRCLSSTNSDGKSNSNDNTNHNIPFRTVYVGVNGAHVDQVKNYFEGFGEIESVSMRFGDYQERSCLVQFKREEDAAKALQCAEKPWHYFEARPADSLDQPDHPMNKPPDSASNINCVLNDDCLQEIFERLRSLEDLTNVAGVCVRFNKQAKITFDSQHKHLDISRVSLSRRDLIETVLKHFGKHIRSLSTRTGDFKTEATAIDVIGRCCGPKLKQLELNGFQFQSDLQALRPIFDGIEQLKLRGCYDSIGSGELMAGCVELKSLELNSCDGFEFKTNPYLTKQTFSKLQEFSLNSTNVENEMFDSFVIRHPALIKLSIENTSITPSVFRTIGQHAKSLQELKFIRNGHPSDNNDEQIRKDAAYIGQLTSLKKLHIDLESVPLLAVMNTLVARATPIECLEAWFRSQLIQDDAMKYISRLKQIKSLRLAYQSALNVTDEDVIGLAKNLPELEELDVSDSGHEFQLTTIGLRKMLVHATKLKMLKLRWIESIKIDIDDYKAMLSTVQQRKEEVPLMIQIHGKADQVDVPATVLAKNRKTLNIKVNLTW